MAIQLSGSLAITGSLTTSTTIGAQGAINVTNATNPVSFTSTASLYSDGGVRFTKDMYVSGTAYFNNVTVFGTQSIAYISSSQLNIGTNLITVNTDTPTVRFGGLAVYDSGSTGLTGSILWDSENNHWVYTNPSGSTYSGGMLISGPRNTNALGSEVGTTACALMMGQGGDHITSSAIFHYGNATCFYGQSFISSSGNACFSGQVCSNTVSTTDGTNTSTLANNYLRYNGGDFYVDACAVGGNFRIRTSNASALDNTALFICGGNSNIGIGTTTPAYKLDVNGSFSFTTGGNYLQYSSGILYHGNYYQYPSGNDYLLFARTSGGLNFGTNDTQRLSISSTGIASFTCQICTVAAVTADLRYTGTGYITYDTSISGTSCLIIRQDANERLRFTGAGIACFACQVCTPAIDIMPSGAGVNTAGGILRVITGGTAVGIGVGQSNTNRYTQISANDLLVYNDDFFIATRCAFPLSIGTCYTSRLTFAATGEACFRCQVCAPVAIISGCVSIGTTSNINQRLTVQGTVAAAGTVGYTLNSVTNGNQVLTGETAPRGVAGLTAVGTADSFAIKTDPLGRAFGTVGLVGAAYDQSGGGRNVLGIYGYALHNAATSNNTENKPVAGLFLSELGSNAGAGAVFNGTMYGIYASSNSSGATNSAGAIIGVYGVATGRTNDTTYGGYFAASGGTSNYGLVVSSGNVGISNTSPQGVLHIGAALASSGDAAAVILKQTSTTPASGLYIERSAEQKGYYIYISGANDSLTFQRNNSGTKSDVLALSRDAIACFASRVCSAGLTVEGTFVNNGTTGDVAYISSTFATAATNGRVLHIRDSKAAVGTDSYVSVGWTSSPGQDVYIGKRTTSSAGFLAIQNSSATELLTINLSSANVGIGTTTPNYKLEVSGNACFTGGVAIGGSYCAFALNVHGVTYQIGGSTWVQNGYGYVNSGATTTGLFPLSDNTIQLKIANSAALTINASNNVGIGTTDPQKPLELRTGGTSTTPSQIFAGGISQAIIGGEAQLVFSSNISPTTGLTTASELTRAGIGFQYISAASPSEFSIGIQCTNVCNSNVRFFNGCERMRITSGGCVIVNGTSASSIMTIYPAAGSADTLTYRTTGNSAAGALYAYSDVNGPSSGILHNVSITCGGGANRFNGSFSGWTIAFDSRPASDTMTFNYVNTSGTYITRISLAGNGITCFGCAVSIGAASTSAEANLFLGAQGTTEGGQLVLQKGTSCSCATHLDNYQDSFRVLVGDNTGSNGVHMLIDHKTRNACFYGTIIQNAATISNNNTPFGTQVNGGYRYFQGTLANGEKFGSQAGTYVQGFYFISWFDGVSGRGYAIYSTIQPTANAGTVLISSGGSYTASASYNASNAISFAFDGSSRGAVLSNNTGVGITFYAYVFGGV